MDKWEYHTTYIEWKANELRDSRGKKYSAWVVEFTDGSHIEGMDNILNYFGGNGWELVSVVTEHSVGTTAYQGGADTTAYREMFKRRAQEATS